MIGIYKITSPSGRIYIGQSINVEKRLRDYKGLNSKKQPRLNRSFQKHGFEKHKIEIVCECLVEELNDKERYYQDLFDCIGKNGLNCVLTQSTDRNGRFSEEVLNKRRGVPRPESVKLKISQAHKGRKYSLERRLQMAEISRNPSKEVRLKMSISHLGNKHTEESKRKISEAGIGRKFSLESRNKISERLGKKVVNVLTGEVFVSVTKAARSEGYNVGNFNLKLKGVTKNNTNFKFA